MGRYLVMAISFLASPLVGEAQECRSWSFFVNGGVGLNEMVPLTNIAIPAEGQEYLYKRGIHSLNIETDSKCAKVPNFILGASYNLPFWGYRSRVSLQAGMQNIAQKNYHATGFTVDALFGYDFLKHPHHDLYLETGIGGYFTFNSMSYTWRGLDGDGNQIYIDGVPEQISLNLGEHNTQNVSIPMKLSYSYNLTGHHWVGAYAQGRYNPGHNKFAPSYLYSAGIEYRYALGCKKQKYVRKVKTPSETASTVRYIEKVREVHDTVYINKVREIHDTIYVQDTVCCKDSELLVLFELDRSYLTKYERQRLRSYDFSNVESVELVGHACALGGRAHNKQLARRRLYTVRRFLTSRGVKVTRSRTTLSRYTAPNFRSVNIIIKQKK